MVEFDENVSEEVKDAISARSAWIVGEDIVPSIYYQAFFANAAWNADDESTYRVWIEKDNSEGEGFSGPIEEIDLVLSGNGAVKPGDEGAENVKAFELVRGEKSAFAAPNKVAVVNITPSAALSETYSESVNVIIDGKEYAGLDILSQPIKFNMDKDHRIVIDWVHGEIYESFRIVVNR